MARRHRVHCSPDENAWKKIHTAFNDVELHLITGILTGEGVDYRIWSRRVPQLPVSHGTLGATEIYVRTAEAPMARRLLLIYRNRSPVSEA